MKRIVIWICGAMLLLLDLTGMAQEDSEIEQRLLDQLTDIYLGSNGSIDVAIANAQKMCGSIEAERMPRAWLRCLAFQASTTDRETLQPRLAAALTMAEAKGFEIESIDLRLVQAQDLEAKLSSDEMLKFYRNLLKDAEKHQDILLIGRIGLKYAEYLYSISDIPAAMLQVKKTLQQVKPHGATESLIYHDLLATMALMLYATGETEKAISVWQESLDWAMHRSHRANQSIIAYNIANAMVKNNDTDDARIRSLFELAQSKGKENQNEYAEAMGYYGEGKWRVKRKQYPEAVRALEKSRRMFLAQNPTFALLSLIYYAEALTGLGQNSEAIKALHQAEKELKPDLTHEKLMILDNYYRLYEASGDSTKALQNLKSYLNEFKSQVESEKKNEIHKLSTSLGLKVEEERNQILEKEKAIQAEKLSFEREKNQVLAEQVSLLMKFRLVSLLATGLSILAFLALLIVWRQSREINRSRQRIKEILDNINEGILLLSPALTVKGGYSPYLEKILGMHGQSLENRHINSLLFSGGKQNSDLPIMIKETLTACLGEKELSWELNCSQLPSEIDFGAQVIELHWQALYNRQGFICGYLVSIRDVTEDRKIKQEIEAGKKRIQELQNRIEEILASDLTKVSSFFQNVDIQLPDVEASFHQGQNITMIFHKLHGWKGAARTLGLKQIATRIHHVESCLDLQTQTIKPQAEENWRDFMETYKAFGDLLRQMLVSVQHHSQASPEDLYAYASTFSKEMLKRFRELRLPCEGLQVKDAVMEWRMDRLPDIQEAVMHAINNSIDHGFMWPSQQNRILPPARISIEANHLGSHVSVIVQDNGAGINWERLQKKAADLGYVPEPGQKLTEVLFRDGMSTAAGTTETSGRGVGLGAIKSICDGFNGHVELDEAGPGGGTILSMTFPSNEITRIAAIKEVS